MLEFEKSWGPCRLGHFWEPQILHAHHNRRKFYSSPYQICSKYWLICTLYPNNVWSSKVTYSSVNIMISQEINNACKVNKLLKLMPNRKLTQQLGRQDQSCVYADQEWVCRSRKRQDRNDEWEHRMRVRCSSWLKSCLFVCSKQENSCISRNLKESTRQHNKSSCYIVAL